MEVVPDTKACWVQVNWLLYSRHATSDNFSSIGLNALEGNRDVIVEDGALGSKQLCLKMRDHLSLIRYTFDDPGHQLALDENRE